ncbi:MAG: class I SAM-dependent methyltransferase [Actinobacteria bacterium]|nr:class I SAM-dependent methyltransferase [Actinomycetota bacterium]
MDHFYDSIPGWFDFADVYAEMVRIAPTPARFVEVGAALGKSTAFLAVEIINSGKAIRFDVVDAWPDDWKQVRDLDTTEPTIPFYERFMRNMRAGGVADIVHPIWAHSVQAAGVFGDQSCDFVWLDAAHDYEAVRADLQAWIPKVKPGGWIGGHDFNRHCSGVVMAVLNELTDHEWQVRRNSWLWLKP